VPLRSARGLARSFQISSLFGDFTALDNVALAVQAHAGHSFRFWQPARAAPELRDPARAALARVGLAARADTVVARMSHGEHRQLEFAMALATKPRLLLLDEPSLGLAPLIVREVFRIIASLRELGVSILLVEQNARAALETADYGYVLETGEIVHSGPAADLMHDPKVAASYLGRAEIV
jgi:branched-chain amino acid transport system ATP-binding protein